MPILIFLVVRIIPKPESLDEFFGRIVVSHCDNMVLVWKTEKLKNSVNLKSIPERWTIEKARNYILWLKGIEEEKRANKNHKEQIAFKGGK